MLRFGPVIDREPADVPMFLVVIQAHSEGEEEVVVLSLGEEVRE